MKSTITCDMEGVIETMNQDAEKIFGYNKEELVGKKRVSIFSPGEIVLQNVANWLDTAVKDGEYIGETIFVNKKGENINAKIRITPTFKNGKNNPQTGYCGVTELIDKNVNVHIKSTTKLIKWLAITRMPFTSVSILPIFLTAAYFAFYGDNLFNPYNLLLCVFAIFFAHLSINVFNDYFDNRDGTDEVNTQYFQQLSGGSRAIELGLINIKNTKILAYVLCGIAIVLGLLLCFNLTSSNLFGAFAVAKAGFFLGYYYTARPLRLVARRGLGELSIFLAFGPLLTIGTGFAIFNGDFLNFSNPYFLHCLLLGIPLGLLTTNILLINQFPDSLSDAKTGKNHLVVTFGKKKSRWIYVAIFIGFMVSAVIFSLYIQNLYSLIAVLFSIFFGVSIISKIFKNYNKRSLINSNWSTIYLHSLYSITLLIILLIN